jgi:hypothetical protein
MKPCLSARVFYGVILAGVLSGCVLAAISGWVYLIAGDRRPTGRRIWDGTAEDFLIPIGMMVGATFGGLAGFGLAVILERRKAGKQLESRSNSRSGD